MHFNVHKLANLATSALASSSQLATIWNACQHLLSLTTDVSQLISKQITSRHTLTAPTLSAVCGEQESAWPCCQPFCARSVFRKLADILTLLWPSMACSSRSLITCGVAVAAVIAWRSRGSGRTQTAESPEEAAVGNLPTLTGPTEDPLRGSASCFLMLLSLFSFAAVTI